MKSKYQSAYLVSPQSTNKPSKHRRLLGRLMAIPMPTKKPSGAALGIVTWLVLFSAISYGGTSQALPRQASVQTIEKIAASTPKPTNPSPTPAAPATPTPSPPASPAPATLAATAPAASDYLAPRGTFANSYTPGQCTWYVASRRRVPSGWGNAGRWMWSARAAGWATGSVPAVGAIAWTPAGYYGHVAIVEQVSGDSVLISEMNYYGPYRTDSRWISAGSMQYIY